MQATSRGRRFSMNSLYDPLQLPCGLVVPNRIMKAAMSEALADPRNSPDARLERLYRRWSQGGYGLLITGNVMVDRTQLGEPGNVVIEDDRDLAALTRWVKSTHDAGVPIWAQLNHPGRQSNPLAVGHTPVAPSAVPMNLPGSPTPRALTSSEIEDIIQRFATAAAVCEAAGFDGVQVHAAHGYLVTQFLSQLTNLRDDDWGGDPLRRMRFLLEVVRRIRARVSPGFAVSVKLNSADFQRGGFSEDESRNVMAALAGEGLDMIEISGGNYESPAMSGSAAASTRAREAYFLDYACKVRQLAGNVPLAVTGGFRSRDAMQDALVAGGCDLVGIARPAVITSDAAAAMLSGRVEVLPTRELQYGMRRLLGRFVDVKALDGVLNISWSTDQLHRMGAGLEPDLDRGRLATTVALLHRNGAGSFRPKRGVR
jgi:2,4-dienoyl-CoA reductase-like NADH-dependent reductase (Old Yellow Enzyme family)